LAVDIGDLPDGLLGGAVAGPDPTKKEQQVQVVSLEFKHGVFRLEDPLQALLLALDHVDSGDTTRGDAERKAWIDALPECFSPKQLEEKDSKARLDVVCSPFVEPDFKTKQPVLRQAWEHFLFEKKWMQVSQQSWDAFLLECKKKKATKLTQVFSQAGCQQPSLFIWRAKLENPNQLRQWRFAVGASLLDSLNVVLACAKTFSFDWVVHPAYKTHKTATRSRPIANTPVCRQWARNEKIVVVLAHDEIAEWMSFKQKELLGDASYVFISSSSTNEKRPVSEVQLEEQPEEQPDMVDEENHDEEKQQEDEKTIFTVESDSDDDERKRHTERKQKARERAPAFSKVTAKGRLLCTDVVDLKKQSDYWARGPDYRRESKRSGQLVVWESRLPQLGLEQFVFDPNTQFLVLEEGDAVTTCRGLLKHDQQKLRTVVCGKDVNVAKAVCVLQGVDDGARSVEKSLALSRPNWNELLVVLAST